METELKQLSLEHPAVRTGRTIFMKQVKDPGSVARLLQPASTNKKLGNGARFVTKGKWKGLPMFQLTLEERSTCPTSCQQWRTCYGNNMPFANRIDVKSDEFLVALEEEIATLCAKNKQGILVRLHVLGDFFSVAYVRFWQRMLKKFGALRLFGYTHRDPLSAIGKEITKLNSSGAWIRWSDVGDKLMAANVNGPGITCPEQTGRTDSCLTCGLCWSTPKPINFLAH